MCWHQRITLLATGNGNRLPAMNLKDAVLVIHQEYGATARDAIFGPILREIDRQKPVPPRRTASAHQDSPDLLTAPSR